MIRSVCLVALLLVAGGAFARPCSEVDWLTTFEIGPGETLAVWSLIDSFAVWPSSFDGRSRRQYESGHLEDARYMFEHKGDYLRVIIYLRSDSRWLVDSETRVVLRYGEEEISSIEIVFPTVTRDAVVCSSTGLVLGDTAGLMRSRDDGYRAYVRFAPGSLPRPERRWFRRGNRWGVVCPDSGAIVRGGSHENDRCVARPLSDSVGSDAVDGHAGAVLR